MFIFGKCLTQDQLLVIFQGHIVVSGFGNAEMCEYPMHRVRINKSRPRLNTGAKMCNELRQHLSGQPGAEIVGGIAKDIIRSLPLLLLLILPIALPAVLHSSGERVHN